jgi:aspartate aminotransferase
MVQLAGGTPVFVAGPESKDYKLTPETLRPVLTSRTRLFLLTSPSNPSGVTYTPDEIRALAAVLQERDLWVMSDEIYDRLLFDGAKRRIDRRSPSIACRRPTR